MKLFNGRFLVVSGVALAAAGLLGLSLSAPTASLGLGTDASQVKVIEAAPSDETPDVGEDVAIAVVVTDDLGNPVAGAACSVSIASQPGTDASVATPTVTTDDNGQASATVNVGSTAGTIDVAIDCGGVTANVSLVAGTAGAAAPPASLPSAGSSSDLAANPMGPAKVLVLALMAVFGLVLVGTGAVLTLQQRRTGK